MAKPQQSDAKIRELAELHDSLGVKQIISFRDSPALHEDDQWLDGSEMDTVVLGLRGNQPLVQFNLPTGEGHKRVVWTLIDYNRNFPFISTHESKWRNMANAYKRAKLGWTEADRIVVEDFDKLKHEWFERQRKAAEANNL